MSAMDAYREFTGKSVEEALKNAREEFGVGLDDLDFEILTPGSRGVLGMGAEPARVLAAPRSALGGAAPKREAAASKPLPTPPPRDRDDDRGFGRRDRFGDRDRGRSAGPGRDGDRGGRGYGDRDRGYGDRDRGRAGGPPREDRGGERYPARPPREGEGAGPAEARPAGNGNGGEGRREDRRPRYGDDRGRSGGPARDDRGRREGGHGDRRGATGLSEREEAEVTAARGSVASERAELEAAEASPEALAAGKVILEQLLVHMGFGVRVELEMGETSRLNVLGDGEERESLGALIGRKGERLSALQHLVNLMLSRQMGAWTRVLVDVEDYRGRRERQLREIADRAAKRVVETGKMLQLEPMPALERRWIHLALRDHEGVATQSIG
ncbi:MAG TPA: Jag N-terminal domain-containing protein, partial [Candidatus Limnocylindrales bacterium]|nr:Jag N-terminal domain-containing protein [Candidatus Limnocylindrales bacterium]